MIDIKELIQHPEQLDRDTLYELRSILALYPYFQTARLLMLQNLYLLHDPTFDEELRRSAIYITNRRVLFQLIEGAHYKLTATNQSAQSNQDAQSAQDTPSRTLTLIDSFLDSIPKEDDSPEEMGRKRKPTPADAAVDYVAYLLESEAMQNETPTPQMKGQDLIDTFLQQEQGRIMLSDLSQDPINSQYPEQEDEEEDTVNDEEYFTETLARIYIKQGRYQKALDIIERLNQQFPHKNAYFADQMRFLEKLIINNNKNKN